MPTAVSTKARKTAKVSMRTIAKKAGVSATTVSLALRDDPSISHATKEKIREIQRNLGYQPNPRTPRQTQTSENGLEHLTYHVVGVDLREENYAPFLHGVSDECRRRSIKLELQCSLEKNAAVEVIKTTMARPLKNQALILSGTLDDSHIEAAGGIHGPLVVLGNYSFSSPVAMVGFDLMGATLSLLTDLKDQGMKKLAVVLEDPAASYERMVVRCLRGAFLELGYSMEDELLIDAGVGFSNIGGAAEAIIESGKSGLYIVTCEPHCAQHLVLELHTLNPAAAQRIPLVSLGDAGARRRSRHFRIFDVGKESCGRMAVFRAAELLRDPQTPPCTSLVSSPGWVR